MVKVSLILTLVAILGFLPTAAVADNVALGKSVTGSAYFIGGTGEVFPFDNVTDGRYNDSGAANDWSFWLTPNRSGHPLIPPDFVTIDLEALYTIDYFVVQNTHNRGGNDRGTLNFRIEISSDNINWTMVVQNILNWTGSGTVPIPLQNFDITDKNARYVKFYVDDYFGLGGGINEMEVHGTLVPLPGALLLLGSGLLGLGAVGWRRRSRS